MVRRSKAQITKDQLREMQRQRPVLNFFARIAASVYIGSICAIITIFIALVFHWMKTSSLADVNWIAALRATAGIGLIVSVLFFAFTYIKK